MIGKNPLWVAKQHGHSVQTMLDTYAAWLEGTTEADLLAINQALNAAQSRTMKVKETSIAPAIERPFALSRPLESPKAGTRLALEEAEKTQVPDNWWKVMAEREGFEPSKGF
jgi:hypothetical protein